jgi:hypothetical protein
MPRYVQKPGSKLGSRTGPVFRIVLYVLVVLMWVAGPGLIVFGALVVTGGETMVPILVGAGLTLLLTPFGLVLWRSTVRQAADTRRLQRDGVPATAEIITAKGADLDGMVALELRLRVSGDGFDPFEDTVSCAYEDDLRVGTQLAAKVDPADQEFMIVR